MASQLPLLPTLLLILSLGSRALGRILPGVLVDQNEANLVTALPGAPAHSFRQYSGYINVDPKNGRELFYWFVEASDNPHTKPLTLWLNGGPGCSSIGGGALSELGPFYPNKDGDGLILNKNSWISESNLLFLESPAGVGFSYSNTTSDYTTGDAKTAADALKFLRLWLQKYQRFQGTDFYIAGESYAGHYIPQLALLILQSDPLPVKFKGFAVGNAWTDPLQDNKGTIDFWWDRALISDQSHADIYKYCNFSTDFDQHADSSGCFNATSFALLGMGNINIYSVYKDVCPVSLADVEARQLLQHRNLVPRLKGRGRLQEEDGEASYDPCVDNEVQIYLNRPDTQKALHANTTQLPGIWLDCSDILDYSDVDDSNSMLPVYRQLLKYPIRIWVYSGDVDGIVPVTGTRNWLAKLQAQNYIRLTTLWAPWYHSDQVGGHSEIYNNGSFVFVTVRNAGHMVPYTQPARSLVLFRQFIASQPMPDGGFPTATA